MATDISKKLRINEGDVLATLNVPPGFKTRLGKLPKGSKVVGDARNYQQLHWFVLNKSQMEKELNSVLKLLKKDVLMWIYYPKGTSNIQTDLTRDKGWDSLLAHQELHWISLISFDDTWSTFACRIKTERDKQREVKPKEERPIFAYIDAAKKTVRLPDDFAKELKKNKKQEAFFNTLSYTNRKEYVEWIVSAKRIETRKDRITGSIQRLGKGWKNPSNL